MKITTKQLTQTALLLALCIASQFFKNLSVYITGPIVNTIIILATIFVGLGSGIIISVIAPITAFLIASSPIMAGIPLIIPAIMLGNITIAYLVWVFQKKFSFKGHLAVGLVAGSIAKGIVMSILIVAILLPMFGENIAAKLPKPEALPMILQTARFTFSVTQFITALSGSVLAYIIMIPLKSFLKNDESSNA